VHGFIASNRVADLLSLFKVQIVQKLVPGLRKEGYAEESSDSSTHSGDRPGAQPAPAHPRPSAPPEPPHIPGQQPYSHIPPQNPLEIGRRDREPFAFPGGANPFAPPPLFPGASGDGMLVGPGHPMFGPRRGGMGSPFGAEPRGPWGGDGLLPPMGAPPGARFDPVGPSPGPRFPGGGGRGMPGFGNLRDPDNDEFMPPGAVSGMSICGSSSGRS
jgi:proteasome inhibitor subunit 1 (PI31)